MGKERVFSPSLGLQEYRNSWESILIIQKSVPYYARWIEMAREEAPCDYSSWYYVHMKQMREPYVEFLEKEMARKVR